MSVASSTSWVPRAVPRGDRCWPASTSTATSSPDVPTLVIGAGLDRQFAEADSARLAEWLDAEYQPFGAHSHYGAVLGEQGFDQVADTIRSFLEHHRL